MISYGLPTSMDELQGRAHREGNAPSARSTAADGTGAGACPLHLLTDHLNVEVGDCRLVGQDNRKRGNLTGGKRLGGRQRYAA